MAHTLDAPRTATSPVATLRTLMGNLKAGLLRRAAYQRTYTELSRLTNRELTDIGVSRCDIRDVSRNRAFCDRF
ncbi:MAG: DUF1127 domain-containing protein [Rhodobacteraceae bacterium]|nr:DUF1127 domain-containing protein [Paracoccaceae bacterium]